jgi:hypothetical protein
MTSSSRPEPLTIRPPSEWRSALVRSTRGCNWNRCRFCGVYPALGEPSFSVRPVDEVIADIEWYGRNMPGLTTAFIGDADPLCRPVDESVEIVRRIAGVLEKCSGITAYARASTLYRTGKEGLEKLAAAGLTRVHVGLESGDLPTLKFHCKGQSPRLVVGASRMVKHAGIELSFYVLLGLGGITRWKEHADATADVINRTDPEFIRMRRIWLFTPEDGGTAAACPLVNDIRDGTFVQQTPGGTVHELRRLIARLENVHSYLVCDHANNYVSVEGRFPDDRERMISEIDSFLALPEDVRNRHYDEIGSRI